jgi:LPXTG-motif cell wall-anchored protein
VILTAGTFFGFGWSAPEEAHADTGDIVAANSISAGDIVYYGNYPQTDLGKVGIAPTPSGAVDVDYVVQSTANAYNGDDGDHYFKIEPLAWKVLENDDDKLFLLSEKAIDSKPYNKEYESITWETCTARSWLNGYAAGENTDGENYSDAGTNFITNAFSAAEQAKIPITDVDNPLYNTDSGGVNTNDKIFYLKVADVDNNASYGFTTNSSRIAQATGYAVAMGAYVDSGSAYWWLRSPGSTADYAARVANTGGLHIDGTNVYTTSYAARPAFYLSNLSDFIFKETAADVYNTYLDLKTLTAAGIGASALSPTFDTGTTEYAVTVPNSTTSITLGATADSLNTTSAKTEISGTGVKSLSVGKNVLPIQLKAPGETVVKTYNVNVTRAAPPLSTDATLSNLSVSPGTLSPAFSSATTEYNVEVPNATDSITLTATTTDANATVTGDGVKTLSVGANKFEITVTAEDGIATKTYTVTVTRAAPDKTANDDEDEDDEDSDDDNDDDEDSDAVGEDENNDDSDSGITSQPKTGDASMLVWLAAMLMSAAVLMLFVLIRIRRKARQTV